MDNGGIDYPIARVKRTNRCPQSPNFGKICDGQLIDTTLDPINPAQRPYILVPHMTAIESSSFNTEGGEKVWRARYFIMKDGHEGEDPKEENVRMIITAIRGTKQEAEEALGKALPEYIGEKLGMGNDKRFEELDNVPTLEKIPNLPSLPL